MSEHFNHLSDRIVDAFRGMLNEEAEMAIGKEGFDQLGMLIEAHVTDEVLTHLERVADQVQSLADLIRGNAEHFQD